MNKTKLSQTAQLPPRRPPFSRKTKEPSHGNWKLVYADFVTVLMAFFLVVWIILFDKVSKIPERDMNCINDLAVNLQALIEADKKIKKGVSPIQIDLNYDGLRLTLLDNSQPMFQSGQSVLSEFAKSQFDKIASSVNICPTNRLRIEGYTDASKYAGGVTGYGNWELSAERANSARRELLARRVTSDRISQVIGYGDSVPSLPDDPENPLNRRISITVLPL